LKFLIVEDELIIAILLKSDLVRAGYGVCGMVTNGEQAIRTAQRENPDVILMDIHLLGEMDGIQAAHEISTFSNAQIIFTTGYSDLTQKERAMALNPAAYLIKPVDVHQIAASLALAG
jgi:CheY-like chemotaxis protein